jgi:E3 ubiquitin-protein ligase HERC2
VSQRIWSLQKMHQLLTSKDAPKIPDSSIVDILSPLMPYILRQYEYEEPQVRTGIHLMHSEYFKTMVVLTCDMLMDSQQVCLLDAHKWAWFKRYCNAVRIAQSLIRRVQLPRQFCLDVRKKLVDIVQPQNAADTTNWFAKDSSR